MHFPLDHATVALWPLVGWFLCFAIKHVLADFYLQPSWMALGKEKATDWARPLIAHCAIHAACTTLLLLALRLDLWFLGAVDFFAHVLIDRAKSIILRRGRITQNDRPFWMWLGIDQTLHHMTGFALALAIAATG